MTTFNFVDFNGLILFDETQDILSFDPGISAADIFFESDGSNSSFSHGGITVILDTSPYTLTTTNVTFANGSRIVIGDNTTGTTADDAANTVVGGAGDDLLIGA